MITVPRRAPAKPKIESLSYREWLEGTVTSRDDGRTPLKGLRASGNVQLSQDGTIKPRPSLLRYGTQPTGTILGDIFEFVQVTGSTKVNWMGCLQNVAGTTKFYISKDAGSWTVCNGKTFDNTAPAEYLQAGENVLIMNGVDNLAYFDVTTAGGANTVVPFTALSTPSAPTLTTNTGLTGTNYNYYYQITANSTVGQTDHSATLTVPVSLQREAWVVGTHSIKISWSAVTNATSYNVYLATVDPATTGTAVLIASGVNGLTYTDDGSAARQVNLAAPVANTTAGPVAVRGSVINGQIFLIDATDQHLIKAGGNLADTIMDFSPFGGGGDIPVGRGTKEFPVAIKLVQSGQGSKITVFCRGTNGYGKRYRIVPDTITSGDEVIAFYGVEEDNGEDGTDAPKSVVMYKDDAYYLSKDGFKKTGVKAQLQTMLKTDIISEKIEQDVKNLNSSYLDKCIGLASQGVIHWAIANGSTSNNEIWTLDVTRGGAWMKPWNIAADTMMLYNDNSGNTHFIIVSNNVIYELTSSQATLDDTVPFRTNITSGFIKFSENGQDWAKVLTVTFVLQRPQGQISLTVSGRTKGATLAAVGDKLFTSTSTVAGWGEAGWGGAPGSIFGWSNFTAVPVAYADASRDIAVKINKLCKWITWELNTSGAGVDYQLSDVIIRFVRVGYIKTSS